MQGIPTWIPTDEKITYLNLLLKCGFHTLDFGSFVSPKAIPQMADTAQVLRALDLNHTQTRLLAIVANTRGAEDAVAWEEINYLGFPFSVSETFQQRNTRSSIAESMDTVAQIQDLCMRNRKELVVYLSMGFGNPYGDPWNTEIVQYWAEKVRAMGIRIISLADTIGAAKPDDIRQVFAALISNWPDVTFGAHFHSTPNTWQEKTEAAWQGGCRRFDGAIKGIGGCPFAKEELTGNLATENLIHWLQNQSVDTGIHATHLQEALLGAERILYYQHLKSENK